MIDRFEITVYFWDHLIFNNRKSWRNIMRIPNRFLMVLSLAMIFLFFSSCQKQKPKEKTTSQSIKVKDFLGREVVLSKKPLRIVSLAPNVTELIYALGAEENLIGVSRFCNYPPQAKEKPQLAGFSDSEVNLEAIVSVQPDLVIATPTRITPLVGKFENLDIPFYAFSPENILDLLGGIKQLGVLLRHESQADSLINRLKREISEMQQARSHFSARSVFLEISATPLTTATNLSFVGQILMIAGGLNISGDLKGEYPQVNPEFILENDPETIIIAHPETTIEEIKARPGWSQLQAVKNGRICVDLNQDVIFRAGPRLSQGITEFYRCLYPNFYTPSDSTQ